MKIYDEIGTPFAKACQDKLSSSIAKGVSKHKAREEKVMAGSKRKSSGMLHADRTIDGYADIVKRYAQWIATEHSDCRKLIAAHKRHYDREYIQAQIDKGLKAATIKTYTAALAFLHNCTMDEVHANRPMVRTQDATRSRAYSEATYNNQLRYRSKHGENRVADIMQICRMTGLREDEAEQVRPSNFHLDQDRFICHLSGNNDSKNIGAGEQTVWTKGGRERTIEILPKYTGQLREILSRYETDERICSKIPDRIDVHGIRSMYACELYQAYARPVEEISVKERTVENGKSCPSRYRDAQGMVWDRRALLRVSASLGHSRSSVVVASYLWRLRE